MRAEKVLFFFRRGATMLLLEMRPFLTHPHQVMLAERKGTNKVVAIKMIKKDEIVQNDDYECARVEKSVMAASRGSPFIAKLYSTFQTEVCTLFYLLGRGLYRVVSLSCLPGLGLSVVSRLVLCGVQRCDWGHCGLPDGGW